MQSFCGRMVASPSVITSPVYEERIAALLGSSAEGEESVVGPTSGVRSGLTCFVNWSLDETSSVDNTRGKDDARIDDREDSLLGSSAEGGALGEAAWLTEAGLE